MSIELVISGGDSFTYGCELDDDDGTILEHVGSKLSWANLVANKLDAKHINVAVGGRSNGFIVRHIINKIYEALQYDYKPEEIFVQVMWTFVARQEIAITVDWPTDTWFPIDPYVCEDESKSDWFIKVPKDTENWKESRDAMHKRYLKNESTGLVDYAKSYYSIISDLHHTYNSLFEILSLQEMLEKKNIKYLFTYVNKHVMNGLISTEKFTDSLHNFIKFDEWYKFPGDDKYVGFDDWAKFNKYEYATSHPLEKAHEDAAELIYDHISNIRR